MKHLRSWILGLGILSVATALAWGDLKGPILQQSSASNPVQFQPLQSAEMPEQPEGVTTIQDLEDILKDEAEEIEVQGGQLAFRYDNRTMVILTSETHDRMRILAPIASEETLTDEQRNDLLEANFNSALDGRYAVSNGIVFAVFLHPLSSLSETEFRSALRQVSSLVATYGSSYSSGEIQFGAQEEDPIEGLPAI